MCSSGYSSMEQRKLASQTEREGGEYEIQRELCFHIIRTDA